MLLVYNGINEYKACCFSLHKSSIVLFADERYFLLNNSSVKPTSGHNDVVNTKHLTDTYDRPGSAYAEGNYVQAGKSVESHEDEPGKSIPKTSLCRSRNWISAC